MKPELSRAYERYCRKAGLSSHGRRVERRQTYQALRLIKRTLAPFKGKLLTPDLADEMKQALIVALEEGDASR